MVLAAALWGVRPLLLRYSIKFKIFITSSCEMVELWFYDLIKGAGIRRSVCFAFFLQAFQSILGNAGRLTVQNYMSA